MSFRRELVVSEGFFHIDVDALERVDELRESLEIDFDDTVDPRLEELRKLYGCFFRALPRRCGFCIGIHAVYFFKLPAS